MRQPQDYSPDWDRVVRELQSAERAVLFSRGLSRSEIEAVETFLAVRLPPDLADFLRTAVPVGEGFPDWRDLQAPALADRLGAPRDGVLFDVEHNDFWHPDWEQRPAGIQDALGLARERLREAPALIPVYMHRMLPAEPCRAGNPVLSVKQTDIIVYGPTLLEYLLIEFKPAALNERSSPRTDLPFWGALLQ